MQRQTQIIQRRLGHVSTNVDVAVKVVRTGCVRVPFEALPCNADYSW